MKTNQPSIALAMIVKGTKDEAPLLANALSSTNGYVDAIYLNVNVPKGVKVAKEVLDVAKQFNTTNFITEWHGNFVEARKFIFDKVKEDFDFVMWMDSDDTIDKPEQIKDIIAVVSPQQQGIYVKYDYDHDEFGNVTVSHWVARIVRTNGSYKWQSSIADDDVAVHETLNEVTPRQKAMCEDFKVIHHSTQDRKESSLIRNIKLLEGMHKKQEENGEYDPRTLFYLATHYYDAGKMYDALSLLQDYLMMSGWPEERCEARVYVGNILRRLEQDDRAFTEYLMAIGEYQNSPRPYVELAEMDYQKGRYTDSASWIEKCLALPKPTTTMVQRPMESTFKAYMLAAQAYVNIGGKRLDDAKEYVYKALKLRPLDSDAQKARDTIDSLIEKREDIRAAMRLVRKFEIDESDDRILPFINSLPLESQDNPLILNTRHKYTTPRKHESNEISIYVGQGPLGIWGPWSLESGISGSEEAVIRLSRELANLGWNVTVYATPGERAGVDNNDGNVVTWKQYYEFNPRDEYNVLVAWRNPMFFDADIKARKRYLWLHDVMDKEEFIPERLANIDKVIFVGQYHAELYRGVIPEEKWFVSGNGIDPKEFIDADGKFERTQHRLIYMSAHNRGLKILLDNWKTIKKEVPDATLDVYYGWDGYDAINRDNPERMNWKTSLVKQMKSLPGVTDRGRISHQKIVEEINKADLLAYPCIFNEVYAISYLKAIAGGAYPVATDYAELGNYKAIGGVQVHYEYGKVAGMATEYVDSLIKTLKEGVPNKERERMADIVRNKFSWEQTAENWDNSFKEE